MSQQTTPKTERVVLLEGHDFAVVDVFCTEERRGAVLHIEVNEVHRRLEVRVRYNGEPGSSAWDVQDFHFDLKPRSEESLAEERAENGENEEDTAGGEE